MAVGISQYLRIFKGATTYKKWQSYYVGQTIDGYSYLPFETSSIVASYSADQSSSSVRLPATPEVVAAVEAAIANAYFAELKLYQFQTIGQNDAPPPDQELIASYVGEIIAGRSDLTSLTLELGSSLDPVGAQIPPRRYTIELVGNPAKL